MYLEYMTPKRLWLITLLIFLIYVGVFALLFINGIHNNSRHFEPWLEVPMSAIFSVIIGIGFALIAAVFPWNKKGYQHRFILAFPVMTSLVIIGLGIMWGLGLYMKSKGLHPVKKYENVEILKD